MPSADPAPLPGNAPFAFRGECVEPARILGAAAAQRLLAARNATGKPNADVLRQLVGVTPRGAERRRWMLDFSPEMSEPEARLYGAPFQTLAANGVPLHSAGRDDALRNALARTERFLAAPAAGAAPDFVWIEADVVPDDSLVVWARDDDFSAGVLASRAFALWSGRCRGVLAALRSFPFPWPPATPLSSLSRAQEEQRFALARAARAEDCEAIDTALAAAYGWPNDLDDDAVIARLSALHAVRA